MYSTKIFESIEDIQQDITTLKRFYEGISAIPLNKVAKGERIKIALLDSGIDFMHDEFVNRIKGHHNILNNSTQKNIRDKVGHGSFTAGLVSSHSIGLLPNVNIYSVKITDDEGRLNSMTVLDGIKWSILNNIDIICMPFGSKNSDIEISKAIRYASQKNIIMIASAGNDPTFVSFPARQREVICVGSVDYSFERMEFSSVSDEIDIVLPSVDIPSCYSYERYALSSGTSAAVGIASALVGLLQDLRKKYFGSTYNILQLRKWFRNNCIDLGMEGQDEEYGFGIPNFEKIYEELRKTKYKPKKIFY